MPRSRVRASPGAKSILWIEPKVRNDVRLISFSTSLGKKSAVFELKRKRKKKKKLLRFPLGLTFGNAVNIEPKDGSKERRWRLTRTRSKKRENKRYNDEKKKYVHLISKKGATKWKFIGCRFVLFSSQLFYTLIRKKKIIVLPCIKRSAIPR